MPVSRATALKPSNDVFAANRAVGRIALSVKAAAGATRRARLHEHGSLRVRCPGPPAGELEAMIINTAGGMAGGDRFDLGIAVGTGARLVVTTAAAEKIYRALSAHARVAVTLSLAAESELAWLPQETILFDGARLRRTIDIDLAPSARLILAEAIVFGRTGMGERVEDGALFDRWRVRRDGRVVYAETMRLDGAMTQTLHLPVVAKGGVAVATIVAVPGDESMVASVRARGEDFGGEVGASTWNGIAVLRLVAPDGGTLRRDLVIALAALRHGSLPRLWLN
jgi:urease accessory protein